MSRRVSLPLEEPTEPIPDVVRDEAIIIPPCETGYWVLLDDATVEALAKGYCPEELSQRMHRNCLDWKRRHYRNDARVSATDEGSR